MSVCHRELLKNIRTFPSLVKYLRDELDWPIQTQDFEELTFDYTAEELGIDSKNAAKIQEIKRLRPLWANQPWGIFFVKFEPKRLPVVALRRILSRVVVKKRASANSAERAAWEAEDLLFVSNYGEGEERKISLAHFTQDRAKNDLPTLKVLGWDNLDTALHLDHVAEELHEKLAWPEDENNIEGWRQTWRSAFILRHREVITTSKALAMKLAELARDLRARIKSVMAIETDDGPITKLMKAFKEALIHDLDNDSFSDMYAQTIAYGLLSARISNPKSDSIDDFKKHFPVTNPFLKELMETFVSVGDRKGKKKTDKDIDFDEIGVNDVVELLDDANMEAVVRDFGDRNPQEDPVIHFYELFLKEYDAKKRMQRGVFYTPRPVVSFIVRSVDEFLRIEFGLEYGLADTTTWGEMAERYEDFEIPEGLKPEDSFVQILDPATGTGTFLVEVIDLIHKTMMEVWKEQGFSQGEIDNLWNEYVPKNLLPRLFGYEILMAPYAIAHLKIGLKLYETNYRFSSDERAHIYLTNTLEPPQDFSDKLAFAVPALAHEAEAVNKIKSHKRFTVVIGNPPYSISSLNAGEWITNLIELYKIAVKHEKNIQPLSDDYLKFIRFAHHLIGKSSVGVLAYITNHTYLSGLIHRGVRHALITSFDAISVLDLHGSALIGLETPDGGEDKNVFDIQQGVGIIMCRRLPFKQSLDLVGRIDYEELWGTRSQKYSNLLSTTSNLLSTKSLSPEPPNWFFVPMQTRDSVYDSWLSLPQIFGAYSTGFVTGKDEVLVSYDKANIKRLCEALHDRNISDAMIYDLYGLRDTSCWPLFARRAALQQVPLEQLLESVRKVLYRPFDTRFTIYTDLLQRARLDNMQHMFLPNIGLIASRIIKGERPAHCYVSNLPIEKILISPKTSNNAFLLPLYLRPNNQLSNKSFDFGSEKCLNFTQDFLQKLAFSQGFPQIGPNGLPKGMIPEDIFQYLYSVLHSPEYRSRYAEFMKIDFPRLPLTGSLDLFQALAELGGELVSLHLMESPKLNEHITKPVGSVEFQVEKVSYSDETVWIDQARTRGFQGVSDGVWNFHIGGYQVCEKWLKDRQAKGGKNPRPGRLLTDEDIVHYQKIVVVLNETIRIMSEIDEVIDKHGGWPDAFK